MAVDKGSFYVRRTGKMNIDSGHQRHICGHVDSGGSFAQSSVIQHSHLPVVL